MPVLEPCGCTFSIADRSKLHTECEMHAALRKDAERYRWLRDGCDNKGTPASWIAQNHYGKDWDAAIDAAIKEQP